MKIISSIIRSIISKEIYWVEKIKEDYDILCKPREVGDPLDTNLLRQVYNIFHPIPAQLIKDCGVKE